MCLIVACLQVFDLVACVVLSVLSVLTMLPTTRNGGTFHEVKDFSDRRDEGLEQVGRMRTERTL